MKKYLLATFLILSSLSNSYGSTITPIADMTMEEYEVYTTRRLTNFCEFFIEEAQTSPVLQEVWNKIDVVNVACSLLIGGPVKISHSQLMADLLKDISKRIITSPDYYNNYEAYILSESLPPLYQHYMNRN